MKQQTVSKEVFLEKYAKNGEQTHEDVFRRVAAGLAACEPEAQRAARSAEFFANMSAGAVGAGRIMSAAGTDIDATLANCFVQPVGDCIQGEDAAGYPGIYEALRMAAETMRRGGGVGYDFSRIRPRNAVVKGTNSFASGPCSYMDVFDASCRTVESAGSRRGAQMGILRIDHPDILDFIRAKRTPGRWNNFNVSVGVTDAFMETLLAAGSWELVHQARPSAKLIESGAYLRDDDVWVYESVPAQEIWDVVMQSTYDFAEPGIVYLSNMNKDNNLRAVELIEATNPCGEQPLPKYGCCDLGPIDLTRFVTQPFGFGAAGEPAAGEPAAGFDFERFGAVIATQVRMLDNVLDVTMWPLQEQRAEAQAKRRIGVGFSGLGNALAMLGLRYDSSEGRAFAQQIACHMRDTAYRASIELAKERGAFALFNVDDYLAAGTFASRLPEEIRDAIRAHGIRNSHLLSIAPVGTISLAFFDNASNGIEPPFALAYERKKRMSDGSTAVYACEDHAFRQYIELSVRHGAMSDGFAASLRQAVARGASEFMVGDETHSVKAVLPSSFVTALEMSAIDHLLMMRVVQPYIDSAISKTVNVAADYPFEDFKELYLKAWQFGLKGVATYRPNATLGSVLSAPAAAPAPAAPAVVPDADPLKIVIERRPTGSLPAVSEKIEYYTMSGKKSLYVIVSFAPVTGIVDGQQVTVQRPIEFFLPAGQEGDAQQWVTAAMRSLSLAARGGFVARALNDMRKVTWDRGPVRYGKRVKLDGTVVGMVHESEVAAIAFGLQSILYNNGFLDIDGNQVPACALKHKTAAVAEPAAEEDAAPDAMLSHATGKKCAECGALAVVPRDGCEVCESCHAVGNC